MDRKRILLYTLAFAAFALLVYFQFRHWRSFDWTTFWAESRNRSAPGISFMLHAVGLIYVAYVFRAIRWKIFLRPIRPQASWLELVLPTLIGFTGLGPAGTSRRIHSALSDRPATEAAGFFPGSGLGGGANIRHWRFCRPDGGGHISAEFAARRCRTRSTSTAFATAAFSFLGWSSAWRWARYWSAAKGRHWPAGWNIVSPIGVRG